MAELKGSLGAIGLPAIVQLIGELRHSGSLELFRGSQRGLVEFVDGRVVAAELGGETGLTALARLSIDLADAEFTFVDGPSVHARTLDLGSKDVLAYLSRVADGEDIAQASAPLPVEQNGSTSLGICPLLGFADDPSRHYSRATALHRCFATGAPTLVTGQEQREFCLSGQYPVCPRYRNSSAHEPLSLPGLAPTHESAPVPVPVPVQLAPAPVAAAVASPNMLHEPPPAYEALSLGQPDQGRPAKFAPPPPPQSTARRVRRALLLFASGVAIGLVVLIVIAFVTMPRINGSLSAQKPSVAGAQAVVPLSTATRAAVVATPVPAAVPAVVPSSPAPSTPAAFSAAPSALAQAPTPTPGSGLAGPQSRAPASGPAILDVRFVSGPGPGWIENPPFAAWSDGAFRLQAHQAAQFVAVAAPLPSTQSDVVVSATLRKTGGPPGGGYGIVVRDQNPGLRDGVNQTMNAYVFEAGDLGEFGAWRRDGDHWVDLVPWTRSAAVRPGGSPNDLLVRATGASLIFSINATQVAAIEDDTFSTGGVGAFVGGDYNEVALDRFTVQNAE